MGKPTRVPEIDGLRGLAIVSVIFFHYASWPAPLGSWAAYAHVPFRLAWSGVDLFFVLSGFLIGGILLDARGSSSYFRTFYVRRFCRILPLYALLVALFEVAVRLPAFGGSLLVNRPYPVWSYLSFTQNWWLVLSPGGVETKLNAISHSWSLAVEEQFYCTLPLLVWLLPRRPLAWLLGGLVLLAPAIRHFVSGDASYYLSPCRMDALCLGVLAALLVRSPRGLRWLTTHRRVMYTALGLTASGMVLVTFGKPAWLFSHNYTIIACFYLCVLMVAVSYPDALVAKAARAGWLRRAGVLCYGLYLFHIPVLELAHWLIGRGDAFPKMCDSLTVLATLGALLTTCILASLSWRFFEEPFVRLGHRFTYGGKGLPGSDCPTNH